MSNIAEIARSQFKERLSEELKSLEVPEWKDKDGKPVVIYYRPVIKMSQQSVIMKHVQNKDYDKAQALNLIYRCRDKNGKLIFTPLQVDAVIDDFDPNVVASIIDRMNEDLPNDDDIEGN
tara:strand:- start:2295 stop:2654 length:360 start_codon:yes stop_codon:yes gene_type:complete